MLIASTKDRQFEWSTLLIEVGTVGRRCGCIDAEGVRLSFQHGKNDGKVTLDNETGSLTEPGDACAHDSSLDVHFAPFNASGRGSIVVTLVLGLGSSSIVSCGVGCGTTLSWLRKKRCFWVLWL